MTSIDETSVAAPPARRTGTSKPTGKDSGVFNVFSHAFLLCWGVMVLVPLVWAVLSSFKSDAEIFQSPWSIPAELRWDNFVRAWEDAHIGLYFLNTIVVLAGSLTLTMLLGSMAAYVLARYEFPGNRIIYYAFVGGMTFPVFLALVPLFFVVDNLGNLPVIGEGLGALPFIRDIPILGPVIHYIPILGDGIGLDSRGGVVLVYVAYSLPFTVFFMTAFFRTLPTTIAEAALIDGCSHSKLFFRVMLPMAKPGLISVGIFNFLGHWNQFLLPYVLISSEDKFVLAQGLANLAVSQGYETDFAAMFAGLTLAMLPVLVVYMVFQRQVQRGLTAGALK